LQAEICRSKVNVLLDLYLQRRRIADQEQRLHEGERQELELRHMRELLDSEARFRELFSSAMDAIVAVDSDGHITLVNSAAQRMFRTTAADAIGKEVTRFFPNGVGHDGLASLCESAAASEMSANQPPHSFTACRANGET